MKSPSPWRIQRPVQNLVLNSPGGTHLSDKQEREGMSGQLQKQFESQQVRPRFSGYWFLLIFFKETCLSQQMSRNENMNSIKHARTLCLKMAKMGISVIMQLLKKGGLVALSNFPGGKDGKNHSLKDTKINVLVYLANTV